VTACPEDRDCPDCGTQPGELHVLGCDVERCPRCGRQLLSCGCLENCHDEDAILHRLPWTGEWPDLARCRELGLWCKHSANGPGWVPCPESDPEAVEDLNRLVVECDWDSQARKWVRKPAERNGGRSRV
jgi:hypothetical protein